MSGARCTLEIRMSLPIGQCHICSGYGPLTFEHVPPRSAFNRFSVVRSTLMEQLKAESPEEVRGHIQQRGVGAYTLCARCNSDTGRWYGTAFADWCAQGLGLLGAAKGDMLLR